MRAILFFPSDINGSRAVERNGNIVIFQNTNTFARIRKARIYGCKFGFVVKEDDFSKNRVTILREDVVMIPFDKELFDKLSDKNGVQWPAKADPLEPEIKVSGKDIAEGWAKVNELRKAKYQSWM